ncbi:efflux RND transporter periplasmic adaptor subunit [Nodosilinea nodulosa]|uniref:efflux RND transporter periplasmic adaptor subunit n=1 Tax=Nodosilinea nodulosa TaxID=416001 RepID=UPI0002D5BEFC|nr:efflux RND transporter periplasmic adaptor subunit [Nodosilinea nodulosa]
MLKSPPKQRFSQGFIGLLAISLLTGGSYLLYRQFVILPRQEVIAQTKTAGVETATLPITVSANGTVEPEQQTNVSPKTAGRLEQVTVDEGAVVKTGQILAYMDDSELQGQLIQAKGQLDAAQANLNKLVAGNLPQDISTAAANLSSAQAELRKATSDLQRYQGLYARGAIAAADLSTYQTAKDTAQASVTSAQQALDLARMGSRQEDIAQAKAQVVEAQGTLTTAQTQIDDTVIRAPFSGTVTARYADPGDFVSPSTAASETTSSSSSSILSLASNYQVVAKVAEADIAKIKLGQAVRITADAYPTEQFDGSVAQIAEQATVTSNVTSFEVHVDLSESAQAKLKPGMNVDVEFQAGELANVMVVPTVTIVRQAQGEGVMVMGAGNTPQFKRVETGLTVADKTQIVSGLTGNEQIVLSAAQGLPENRRNIGAGRRSPIPGVGGPPGGSRSGSSSGAGAGGGRGG